MALTWAPTLCRCVALFLGVQTIAPLVARAQPAAELTDDQRHQIVDRLRELKEEKQSMQRAMQSFDARIDELEAAIRGGALPKRAAPKPKPLAAPAPQIPALRTETTITVEEPWVVPPVVLSDAAPSPPASPPPPSKPKTWGAFEPGKGYVLVRDENAELDVGLITYFRYLNQLGLAQFYTDSFGRTKELDLRQDFQWNKANLSFKGWLLDPDFEYRVWIWTQNPAMGQGAQVVVGGHLGYHFGEEFNIYAGVAPLPTDRTTNWTYPFWLKMDNRTIADEFFRGSYTFGIWIDGTINKEEGLKYRAMIANNLSALGISADQLDADPSTVSATIWWMPTTGEYGTAEGFGDYDYHEEVATRFGVHFTRSREDRQSQPDVNDFENSQIRLSDGTLLFGPDPFDTGGIIKMATYRMFAANAGFKYRGWSLEGEYYIRWVDDFETVGFIPVDSLYDTGFSLYASTMLIRDELQFYVAGSHVFGQYGNPSDLTVGFNWYPFSKREIRINAEGIFLDRSPVGGLSYPYVVGGDGWLFNTDFIIAF